MCASEHKTFYVFIGSRVAVTTRYIDYTLVQSQYPGSNTSPFTFMEAITEGYLQASSTLSHVTNSAARDSAKTSLLLRCQPVFNQDPDKTNVHTPSLRGSRIKSSRLPVVH